MVSINNKILLSRLTLKVSCQIWGFYAWRFSWLVVGPPLWKIWKSIGMIRNPIYGKIKLMFQTTNQLGSCVLGPQVSSDLGCHFTDIPTYKKHHWPCAVKIYFAGQHPRPGRRVYNIYIYRYNKYIYIYLSIYLCIHGITYLSIYLFMDVSIYSWSIA